MDKDLVQSNMREMILDFPNQIKVGWEIAEKLKIKQKFNNVAISGMGGSIWPAEILNDWLDIKIPFYINKTYNLPLLTNSNSLAIFNSYSGNTEECLSSLKQAINKEIFSIAVTSGGKLQKICSNKNIPYLIIPSGLVPRMSTGYFLAILSHILLKSGIIEKDKCLELLKGAQKINPTQYQYIEKSKAITQRIKNKIPIIYTSHKLQSLGYVWKIKFNENCKIPCFNNSLPELNHNELEGMVGQNNQIQFYFIFLKDISDDIRINKRIDITAKTLQDKNQFVEIIELKGKTLIEKILFGLILSNWISYYLALEYNINPLSTKTIEEFKKQISK